MKDEYEYGIRKEGKQYMTHIKGVKKAKNKAIENLKSSDPKCRSCGKTHPSGSREAQRDFVFHDICVGCNKKE